MARTGDRVRRLTGIPGVGALNATALVAAVDSAAAFSEGRDLAARPPYEDRNARISILAAAIVPTCGIRLCRLIRLSPDFRLQPGRAIRLRPLPEIGRASWCCRLFGASIRRARARSAFPARRPRPLVRPSGGTGHRPGSTCHSAHACRVRGSQPATHRRFRSESAGCPGLAEPVDPLGRQQRPRQCPFLIRQIALSQNCLP